ncbi:MAG: hypothetical protein A3I05_05825 [Deltaproteobacteria bacterium RIFCSPLOWO2_02_FULL_44_10]|nr:MAG: hypothetical protein A3C46_04650 [Deltaproteobacteria bacterium RIFCSPHIGHO2_02_FULL_44_16]OGQ46127.1 MAG: hypothetical protein A3I05_05825 [Deltaproteobacteria bacterium RIFCSPLOWO2_02_FULL_44_10]
MTNNDKKKKRIAVLFGGESRERDISLKTGIAIAAALKRREYDVVEIDAQRDVMTRLTQEKIDVAFIALHGKYGEDGCIQGLLEWMRIPYTGAGVCGSAIAMNKVLCKRLATSFGVPVARDEVYVAGNEITSFIERLTLPYPVIVKPSREGSTIHVTIVHEAHLLGEALERALLSDDTVLVEEYVRGREVTVGLLRGKSLPIVEIVPKSGFYDFESKYTKGKTDYIVPANISAKLSEHLGKLSEKLFAAIDTIDGSGFARADYMIGDNERIVFLEINTIPGMTETSLVPKAAASAGISFDELCEQILKTASLKVKQ